MKLFANARWIAGTALFALAACGGGRELPPPSTGAPGPVSGAAVSDYPVRIGPPYTINGRTYTPADPSHYDEVGMASFYGEELAGRPTANGEAFRPAGVSAAHRTLPLPSYVEVTSLQTGRTILVRVNDRGPFSGDRIIDLSLGAAQQLGMVQQGTAAVRIRRVQPPESDRARLRAGMAASPRIDTSEQLLTALRARLSQGGGIIPQATPSPDAPRTGVDTATTMADEPPAGVDWVVENAPQTRPAETRPTPTPAPVAATGDYYVQLGAFSSAANAQRLANRAQNLGTVQIMTAGTIRRVRLGPYPNQAAAQQAQSRARAAGFGDARIFRDPAR